MKTRLFFLLLLLPLFLSGQDDQNPCAYSAAKHIVVLGSSTAAGTGPSHPDSTWVNRFTAYQQSVHPGNQVTNLAIGGTTTYHIMPTGFVPPSNRPNPNPSNNVTQAITLGADAIIINMPSNDAANNFTFLEQMSNFNTLVNEANQAGIPVWVCTTQPRTPFGTSQNAIQTQVRDSVFGAFGPFALDFWNPFANGNLDIDPIYDSGDGVHLNDAAHRLLFEEVRSKGILGVIYDTLPAPDHAVVNFSLVNGHPCGDSLTTWRGIATNLGLGSTADLPMATQFEEQGGSLITVHDTIFGGLQSCVADTFWVTFNTQAGGTWNVQSFLEPSGDLSVQNDSASVIQYSTLGYPDLLISNDTVCVGEPAQLAAFSNALTDTVFWYDQPAGGSILQGGNAFGLPTVTQQTTRYATAVRGPLSNDDSLATVSVTTTNFNGIMFNIVADTGLTIDSLRVRMNSTGLKGVVGYYRLGGYQGFENQPTSWQLWGTDAVTNANAGDFPIVTFPELSVNSGDTVGVYLFMQQANATLSYRSSNSAATFSDGRLSLITGSGIAHSFGNTFSPRHFAGEVFYHYGFNEAGLCASPRLPVLAEVSEPQIDLGSDTSIAAVDTLILNAGLFDSYFWNTGNTDDSILVDSTTFGIGPQAFWVEGVDAFGCVARDTIIVTILVTPPTSPDTTTGMESLSADAIRVYPNPFLETLNLEFAEELPQQIYLYNMQGQQVFSTIPTSRFVELRPELPAGPYILLVSGRNGTVRTLLTKH